MPNLSMPERAALAERILSGELDDAELRVTPHARRAAPAPDFWPGRDAQLAAEIGRLQVAFPHWIIARCAGGLGCRAERASGERIWAPYPLELLIIMDGVERRYHTAPAAGWDSGSSAVEA